MEGKGSYKTIAKKYGISIIKIQELVFLAKERGIDFILSQDRNRHYPIEIKLQAVEDYLSGKWSQVKICSKYGIKSRKTLQVWISCYNNGKEFKERTRSERGITMNKGRKTTQEERVEIVAFCIENGKDYGLTMEKYGVS